jgi:ACS family D-galactonate transporter-like MFS transporter
VTVARIPQRDFARWRMLAIVSLGVVALTLNWFDIATAFPRIGAEFRVGLGSLSFLISLFIVGYGLVHLPAGTLAKAIGMKKALLLGLSVQGLAGIMSGLSYNFTELEFFRILSGIGGSLFATVGFSAVVVWFRGKDVTLALGIFGGVAFSVGAAFALYVWVYLQRATDWHASLVIAGVLELVVVLATLLVFEVPHDSVQLGGARFDRAALQASLGSRDLWVYGVALLGGYGAYFTVSQLFAEYATTARHVAASDGGLLSALIVLAGVPGGLLGGYWADRSRNLRVFIVGPLVAVAALLALIPVVSTDALWAVGIGIGFLTIFGFAGWSAVPARVCHIEPDFIAAATGLMLTLAAVGGFFMPIIFGRIVPRHSFNTGWIFLAVASVAFSLIGLAGRNPATTETRLLADTHTPVEPTTAG